MSVVYIVLGGGLQNNGTLPTHIKARAQYVIDRLNPGDSVICSSIFSLNVPPVIDKLGFCKSESSEIAKFIQKKSPNARVFVENASFDTIGSAVFVRSMYDWLLKDKRIVVVTSQFHGPRAEHIYSSIFEFLPILKYHSLQFHFTSNPERIANRNRKEEISLLATKKNIG